MARHRRTKSNEAASGLLVLLKISLTELIDWSEVIEIVEVIIEVHRAAIVWSFNQHFEWTSITDAVEAVVGWWTKGVCLRSMNVHRGLTFSSLSCQRVTMITT